MPNRRAVLAGFAAGAAALTLPSSRTRAQRALEIVAYDQCDPGGEIEPVVLDQDYVSGLITPTGMRAQAVIPDPLPDFASALIDVAVQFDKKNRWNDEEDITAMLDLFGMPFTSGCPGNCRPGDPNCPECTYVSFCAAGIGYCAVLAFAKASNSPTDRGTLRDLLRMVNLYDFFPSPSVPDMYNVAYAARLWPGRQRWVPRENGKENIAPKAGWLVVYDWNKNENPNHIGIVLDSNMNSKTLTTFEFNVSDNQHKAGTIHHCTRNIDQTVMGYIDTTSQPVSSPK